MLVEILWVVFMLGLVVATVVASMREKKARSKAMQSMTPQPMDVGISMAEDEGASDGFGADDAFDAFGQSASQEPEFSAFDDDTFK